MRRLICILLCGITALSMYSCSKRNNIDIPADVQEKSVEKSTEESEKGPEEELEKEPETIEKEVQIEEKEVEYVYTTTLPDGTKIHAETPEEISKKVSEWYANGYIVSDGNKSDTGSSASKGSSSKPTNPEKDIIKMFDDIKIETYGGNTYLQISANKKIQNVSDIYIKSLRITIRTYDKDGVILSDEISIADDIAPGETIWVYDQFYTLHDVENYDADFVPAYIEILKYAYKLDGSIFMTEDFFDKPMRFYIPEKHRVPQEKKIATTVTNYYAN